MLYGNKIQYIYFSSTENSYLSIKYTANNYGCRRVWWLSPSVLTLFDMSISSLTSRALSML